MKWKIKDKENIRKVRMRKKIFICFSSKICIHLIDLIVQKKNTSIIHAKKKPRR